MRNIDEVLREKNSAVEQLRREVEALRLVAPLLTEAGDSNGSFFLQPVVSGEAASEMDWNPSQEAAKVPAKGRRDASDAKFAKAWKISRELRRITAPLLGTSGS
ncbi:MAG: hypothetical protein DMG69_28600 [Acidobacteria bacterium]|nr:MAG: hypothetical protein DMG69_28600 [Acidobacteriota bacterium]